MTQRQKRESDKQNKARKAFSSSGYKPWQDNKKHEAISLNKNPF